jgi:hypothetical protein
MFNKLPGFDKPDTAFVAILAEAGMTDVSPFGIEVQLDDGVRWFLPDGGLTIEHFHYLAHLVEDHDSKNDLAHAVLINALYCEYNSGDVRDAVQKIGLEIDLADALEGGEFELQVVRARGKILELSLERIKLKNRAKTGFVRSEEDRPSIVSTGPNSQVSLPYRGRLTCDRATKTVRLDGSSFLIENPRAFSIFQRLFDADGEIVTTKQLNELPGCKGDRLDRVIKKMLIYKHKKLRRIIRTKVGRGGGYWITCPPEL